jgi:hypothetical protein
VLAFLMALLLFSSQKMKVGASIDIAIDWQSSGLHEFYFEGAIYPDEYNGLPVASIQLQEGDVNGYHILDMSKRPINRSMNPYMQASLPYHREILSLKKNVDRGSEIASLTLFPFTYDSISDTYFQLEYIEVDLIRDAQKSSTGHLRTNADKSNSVLSTGEWYKIPVVGNGVHKIDYDFLQSAGINMADIDPKKIKIYGNGGGMLPQSNNAERPVDLTENALSVAGEADGRFDREDYILFYGQAADKAVLNADGSFEYEKNLYSDTSFYFLTIGGDQGLRIIDKEDLGTGHPKIRHFDDHIIYENDEFNIINSGREWYGEKFDFTLTYDFKFEFPNLVPGTELQVTSAIMGQTYQDASMDLFVNGVMLGQQPVYSIAEGAYLAKGSDQVETFKINTESIPDNDPFTLRMSFNPSGSGRSKANLDYLVIRGKRQLRLYGNQTSFRALQSMESAFSTYEISDAASAFDIWDISDPLKPYRQKFMLNADIASFGAINDGLNEYIIFKDQDYLAPQPAAKIQNQNLRAFGTVDLLIISYPGFLNEATRLADLRSSHDGLEVLVVTTQEIYNEFSSGKQDVTAIRDFIKHIYDQGDENVKLQNVLLFGKGSFDYKNRVDDNTNFVPVYTSRNSLHPINSYSSDDYYGFLDDDEGIWAESYSGDHLMDVGVGRLPVKSLEEARIVVDKLIHYSTSKETFGPWRNELFFIADDGDGNLHQRDADRLAVQVDTSYNQFNVNKIYVDAFEQIESYI